MIPARSNSSLRQIYDQRYRSGYMLDDSFTRWSHGGIELRRVKDTLGEIPSSCVESILDYGCGQGGWVEELENSFSRATLTGVDISPEAIRKSRKRFPAHRFHCLDGMRAPLPDTSFDLVFSYHVLEHVLDLSIALADMTRLLKKGGYLCLIFPCGNTGSFESRLVELMRDGKQQTHSGEMRWFFEDPTHLRRVATVQVVDLLEKQDVQLRAAFYAHQFFGAVEWISRSSRTLAAQMFDVHRALGPTAKLKMLMLSGFIKPLTLAVQLSRIDFSRKRGRVRQVLVRAVQPFKPLGNCVSGVTRMLASLEWKIRKQHSNGSAQFLVFRKST